MSYESSITVNKPGTFLGKKSRRITIKYPDGQNEQFSLLKLKEINIFGRGVSISNDLIYQSVKLGVKINFFDKLGRPYANIFSPFLNETVANVKAQLKAENTERAFRFAKEIILAKIGHQIDTINTYTDNSQISEEEARRARSLIEEITIIRRDLKSLKMLKNYQGTIFSFEGRASDRYWRVFKILIGDKAKFNKRVGRGAKDSTNVLLNYGYGILYSKILSSVLKSGLNPFAGFLHKDRSGKPSLILDLMEIFRQPLVDFSVLNFINNSEKNNFAGNFGSLDKAAIFSFAKMIEERLETKFTFLDKKKYPLKKIIEIQVQILTSFLRNKKRLLIWNLK